MKQYLGEKREEREKKKKKIQTQATARCYLLDTKGQRSDRYENIWGEVRREKGKRRKKEGRKKGGEGRRMGKSEELLNETVRVSAGIFLLVFTVPASNTLTILCAVIFFCISLASHSVVTSSVCFG